MTQEGIMASACAKYQERIVELFLGDLSDDDRKSLEAHLAVCTQCNRERERYAETLRLMNSVADESVPRHFFVSPENTEVSPWRLFQQLQLRWRAALAGTFVLILLLGVASLSRLQMRSNTDGWAIGFGHEEQEKIDTFALKEEILAAIRDHDQENRHVLMEEISNEIARRQTDGDQQTRLQIAEALARLDTKMTGRVERSAEQMRHDTQIMVSAMYYAMAQQQARDIEAMNIRLDSTEIRNAVKTWQTEEVLETLLHLATMNY